MTKVTGSRLTCTFCNKTQDKVKKMIAGPGVYICDECVKECDELLIAEKDKPTEKADSKLKCSFCSKPQTMVQKLLKGPTKYICNECVDLCDEILMDAGLEPWSSSYTPKVRIGPAKPSREEVLEAIVNYVYSMENWKEVFRHAMQRNGIDASEVETEVQKKLQGADQKKRQHDLLYDMWVIEKEAIGTDS
ncbi:MAG: hypothetical protein C5B53_10310 [Candidatus Melainabacteria bacterium]|nr:MAG: hypothetical protein C5B53_10310 [Candidatus Melainabacteria bacterium]